MKVKWETCDLWRKCVSFPYSCAKCWKGKAHAQRGIRLNLGISGHPMTIGATLAHEFLHTVLFKTKMGFLHKILDNIDKTTPKRGFDSEALYKDAGNTFPSPMEKMSGTAAKEKQ